ncbi:protease HtpX [Aureibacillus halotolerans]|uniref:Protease HtpX homolog n=1 Tax=Aureibacillus halotolerans TaxID=1508390 RepID=A0A4R6UB77_9BACI|nr:protease HtpX [Aureibacillus halotolerans]TDQ40334.1 heat shock protein [Aureibacillus halotolerans]
MFKRIMLFVLTNILVIVTISVVLNVLGVGSYINMDGSLNLTTLLIFSAIVGFTGAFISLAISRWMAKFAMRVRVLKPEDPNLSAQERDLVERVHRLAQTAGISKMPQVGIYDSPEVNAFATGPSKNRSLVAVSAGLLYELDDNAVEGVLAHEVAHISNGDMVTMTLLQGVVNTFVVFLARVAAWAVSQIREEFSPIIHFIAIIVFQILFSILGSIVVLAYSRYREYHADKGGADLAGKDKMVHALRSLQAYSDRVRSEDTSVATLKINGKGAMKLFSSHPPLEERIQRLEER